MKKIYIALLLVVCKYIEERDEEMKRDEKYLICKFFYFNFKSSRWNKSKLVWSNFSSSSSSSSLALFISLHRSSIQMKLFFYFCCWVTWDTHKIRPNNNLTPKISYQAVEMRRWYYSKTSNTTYFDIIQNTINFSRKINPQHEWRTTTNDDERWEMNQITNYSKETLTFSSPPKSL